MNQEMTVNDFAEMHGISQPIANSVMVFLTEKGVVTKTDKTRRKKGAGRGRASALFLVPETAELTLINTTSVVPAETMDVEADTETV